MDILGILSHFCAARPVDLAAFPMTGKRYGVGVFCQDVWGSRRAFYPVRLLPSDAAALFPGMQAAGRDYDDLKIIEIER